MAGKYRCVIFDLWGTLVDDTFTRDHEQIMDRFGRTIGLDGEKLDQMWRDAGMPRDQDGLPFVDRVCEFSGHRPDERQSRNMVDCRRDVVFNALQPRAGTKEMFTRLRGRNVLLGMIVNCSSYLPNLWSKYPFSKWFDISVFSCTIGCGKPNPLIYRAAMERLAVPADKCLFVGDGDHDELEGARKVGMDAALMCDPSEEDVVMARADSIEWTGLIFESLSEVTDHVAPAIAA